MKYKHASTLPGWAQVKLNSVGWGGERSAPNFVSAQDFFHVTGCGWCGFWWLNWSIMADFGRSIGGVKVSKFNKCPKCGREGAAPGATVNLSPKPAISHHREGFD